MRLAACSTFPQRERAGRVFRAEQEEAKELAPRYLGRSRSCPLPLAAHVDPALLPPPPARSTSPYTPAHPSQAGSNMLNRELLSSLVFSGACLSGWRQAERTGSRGGELRRRPRAVNRVSWSAAKVGAQLGGRWGGGAGRHLVRAENLSPGPHDGMEWLGSQDPGIAYTWRGARKPSSWGRRGLQLPEACSKAHRVPALLFSDR